VKLRIPILSTAVAITAGLIILYSYFFPIPLGFDVKGTLLGWAIALAAVALLIGIVNLLRVHGRKIADDSANGSAFYSLVLILAFAVSFILALVFGPGHEWSLWLFSHVQLPIESSMMAILAVSLAYAAARLLRRRMNAFSVVFALTVFFVLMGASPVANGNLILVSDILRFMRDWLTEVWATAGARGILIGVALGTIATGLRILMGADRPYSSDG
jgi:hypothetical protein